MKLRSVSNNHPSSLAIPAIIHAHISAELSSGHLVGALPSPVKEIVHITPMDLATKEHSMSKWRLIIDLSSPLGHTVNDGIAVEASSLGNAVVLPM